VTQASYEPVQQVFEFPSTSATAATVEQVELRWWQGTLLSALALTAIYGVAVGEMAVLGVIIHALNPNKLLNIFTVLHNQWVVGVLLGITVLWLIPPHPWTKRVIAPLSPEQPAGIAVGETDGGGGSITALSEYQGRGSSHRPSED
jgi:hypothetical protein